MVPVLAHTGEVGVSRCDSLESVPVQPLRYSAHLHHSPSLGGQPTGHCTELKRRRKGIPVA